MANISSMINLMSATKLDMPITSKKNISNFYFFLVVLSVILVLTFLVSFLRNETTATWEPITATLTGMSPQRDEALMTKEKTLRAVYQYTYTYQGQEYQGEFKGSGSTSTSFEDQTDAAHGSKQFSIVVNPDNPAESVLPGRVTQSVSVPIALFGITCVLVLGKFWISFTSNKKSQT